MFETFNEQNSKNEDHITGSCEINKISLSYLDDKIYIQNNGYEGLALGY